jgi:hypothetical protein
LEEAGHWRALEKYTLFLAPSHLSLYILPTKRLATLLYCMPTAKMFYLTTTSKNGAKEPQTDTSKTMSQININLSFSTVIFLRYLVTAMKIG